MAERNSLLAEGSRLRPCHPRKGSRAIMGCAIVRHSFSLASEAARQRSSAPVPACRTSRTPSIVNRAPSAARNTARVGIPYLRALELIPNADISDIAHTPKRLRVIVARGKGADQFRVLSNVRGHVASDAGQRRKRERWTSFPKNDDSAPASEYCRTSGLTSEERPR